MDLLQPQRTVAELKELRTLTADELGAQRVAFTETWSRGRDWLKAKLEKLPVEVHTDAPPPCLERSPLHLAPHSGPRSSNSSNNSSVAWQSSSSSRIFTVASLPRGAAAHKS
jgi:hypothetical protein